MVHVRESNAHDIYSICLLQPNVWTFVFCAKHRIGRNRRPPGVLHLLKIFPVVMTRAGILSSLFIELFSAVFSIFAFHNFINLLAFSLTHFHSVLGLPSSPSSVPYVFVVVLQELGQRWRLIPKGLVLQALDVHRWGLLQAMPQILRRCCPQNARQSQQPATCPPA